MYLRFVLHDAFGRAGGVKTVTLALARDLAQHHDVELVSLYRFGAPSHPLPPGVRVRTLIDRAGPADRSRLDRLVSRLPTRVMPAAEPRIAQYSAYTDLVLARYLRSIRGGAVVTMQPGLNIALARLGTDRHVRVAQDHRPCQTRSQSILDGYRRYGRRYDAFLALTDEDRAEYAAVLGPGVRVETMPNGAPENSHAPSPGGSRVVVAAGRLERSKGFDLLISAWADVAARHPDWELRIYGEGKAHGSLQKQIERLGLGRTVKLMGFTSHLTEEMALASLFVLSSRAEGYPMVLLEAMGCGLPLISTDCPAGGPRDIIDEGVDGFLVPNEDVAGLAAALNRAIELGPDRLHEMGSAGRAKARERSQAAVAQRWSQLLEELAARTG